MLLPIVAVAVTVLLINCYSIAYRIARPYTLSPWESMIVVDAHRASQGQPIYQPLDRGAPAPHIYGPLMTHVVALVFRVTGPNLYAARVISLIAALIACAILIRIYVDYRKPFDLLFGAALMLSLQCRSRAYFVESRPDMIAWLLATLALICFYRAHHRNAFGRWYPLGLALVILTFLSKQTYACFAAVPLVAILVLQPRPLRKHLLFAMLPLVCLGLTVIVLKQVQPVLYHYMVKVPKMYAIPLDRLKVAWDILIMSIPLYPAAVVGYFVRLRHDPDGDAPVAWLAPKMIWLMAACGVGFAAAVMAFGKQFATINSLLLAWIPMTVFCCIVIPSLVRGLYRSAIAGLALPPLGNFALHFSGAFLIASLTFVTAFSSGKDGFNWDLGHGTREYKHVIAAVKDLSGRVVSPEDPTIPLFANGYIGRNLDAELDATNHGAIPQSVLAEVSRAHWLVHVTAGYKSQISERLLKTWGFKRYRTFGRGYSLWLHTGIGERKSPTTQRTSP
ncbi:MAG: glycosyltransferase family 39 protein [Anaerolineae bacterium]|nr:glycosyltransferase family 39 protein [Phycisphaerae bacterium]